MLALTMLMAAAAPLLAASASSPAAPAPAAAAQAAAAAPAVRQAHAQIVLAPRIVDKQPQGAAFQFSSQESVYCWTRVRGENGRTIRHVWKRDGRVMRAVPLKIGADDYRTWSRKDALWPGHWTIAVEDEDGTPLGPETSFIVGDVFDAGPGYSVEIRDVSPSRLEAMLIAADTASIAGYADETGAVEDLLPGERPMLTLHPPAMPESQDTFDLAFEAKVLDRSKTPRTLNLAVRRVPNPSRLEDWAGTLRRSSARAETRAAR